MVSKNESGCCGGGSTEAAKRETSSALEILRERFARGEIEKAEFEERGQVLAAPLGETASRVDDSKSCRCC
jgi:hypothetical protein